MGKVAEGGGEVTKYERFIEQKKHVGCDHGFDPVFMPDMLFPFQRALFDANTAEGMTL